MCKDWEGSDQKWSRSFTPISRTTEGGHLLLWQRLHVYRLPTSQLFISSLCTTKSCLLLQDKKELAVANNATMRAQGSGPATQRSQHASADNMPMISRAAPTPEASALSRTWKILLLDSVCKCVRSWCRGGTAFAAAAAGGGGNLCSGVIRTLQRRRGT